jgi:hypothetical protein
MDTTTVRLNAPREIFPQREGATPTVLIDVFYQAFATSDAIRLTTS